MSCERTETVLHAYFDQELDPVGAAEFERHLGHCPECMESLTAPAILAITLRARSSIKRLRRHCEIKSSPN